MLGPEDNAPALGGSDAAAPLPAGLRRRRDRVARWTPEPPEVVAPEPVPVVLSEEESAAYRVRLNRWYESHLGRLLVSYAQRPNPFSPAPSLHAASVPIGFDLPQGSGVTHRVVMDSDGVTAQVRETWRRGLVLNAITPKPESPLLPLGSTGWGSGDEVARPIADAEGPIPNLSDLRRLVRGPIVFPLPLAQEEQEEDEGFEFCGDRDCNRCSPGPEDDEDQVDDR